MKKLVFVFLALLSLCACNRMRVKHDHSKHVQYARIPEDTLRKDSADNAMDESWKDEDLIVIPEEAEAGISSSASSDDLERMLRGEEVE